MKKTVNVFTGGMDVDTSPNMLPQNKYRLLTNARIMTDDGGTSGVIENEGGNRLLFKLPLNFTYDVMYHNVEIIGIASYNEYIIVFAKDNSTNDFIIKLDYDATFDGISPLHIDAGFNIIADAVIFKGNLGFNKNFPIRKVLFREINSNVLKMYWTNGNEVIQHCNILDSNLKNKQAVEFYAIGNFGPATYTTRLSSGGTLKVGMVQYAYRLYRLYGQETLFSQPSKPIYVYKIGEGTRVKNFKGDPEGTLTDKSVIVTINSSSIGEYDRIEVIAIHYVNSFGTPECRIIYDGPSTGTTMTVQDNGVGVAPFTYAEFLYLQSNFSAKDIEVFNNRLIAANLTEEYFDIDRAMQQTHGYPSDYFWDARAYRFNVSGSPGGLKSVFFKAGAANQLQGVPATLSERYVAALANYYEGEILASTLNWPTDPTLDCCNIINYDMYSQFLNNIYPEYKFLYQKDGITLGGSGPKIDYEFYNYHDTVDNVGPTTNYINVSGYNASIQIDAPTNAKYFQADEIYRFGIVFIDNFGRRSFVKWIGDIRTPHRSWTGYGLFTEDTYTVTLKGFKIRFVVDTSGLAEAGVREFKIVVVPRQDKDKTILAQGVFGKYDPTVSTYTLNGSTHFVPSGVHFTDDFGYCSGRISVSQPFGFHTPEVSFGVLKSIPTDVFLQPIEFLKRNLSYYYQAPEYWRDPFYIKYSNPGTDFYSGPAPVRGITVSKDIFCAKNYIDITGTSILKSKAGATAVYGTIHKIANNDTPGASFLHTAAAINNSPLGEVSLLTNMKRKDNSLQYGGWSVQKRTENVYKECGSGFITGGNVEAICYGDIFLNYFECLITDPESFEIVSGTYWETQWMCAIPCESTINSNLRHDPHWSNTLLKISGSDEEGYYESGAVPDPSQLDVLADFPNRMMYQYNLTYSRGLRTIEFIPKPLDYTEITSFPTTIKVSEKGFNEFDRDYWLRFPYANSTVMDNSLGEITNIISIKDKFLVYQRKGISELPIEQKTIITSENSQEIATGSAELIGIPVYYSREVGAQYYQSVCRGEKGIYHYNTLDNNIYVFNGEAVLPLTKQLSMQGWFRDGNYENDLKAKVNSINTIPFGGQTIIGTHVYRDIKNNRILFTIFNKGKNIHYTLALNELFGVFEAAYSFKPYLYTLVENNLITLGSSLNDVYIHDRGNKGQFYGTYYPTIIKFTTNDKNDFVKIWSTNEFNSRVLDNTGQDVYGETIHTVRFKNEYQDTNEITLISDDNIVRRMRQWRHQIPFDASTAEYDVRMRSKWLETTMTFNNSSDNKTLILDNVTTAYMNSPMHP